MTLVRIALDVPGPAGDVRATGRVRATPTRRRTVGDAIVLPTAFSSELAAGVATVELAATGLDWCWRLEELTTSPNVRYVTVPDSVATLGYEDLTDVDPATLDPAVEPEAAWTVALDNVVRGVIVLTGDEPRPAGAVMVRWRDLRQVQTVAPANMTEADEWITGTPVADTTDPTIPTGLASSAITDSGFTLTWDASTDNVGVTGYDVRVNGGTATTIAASPRTHAFTGLAADTLHTAEVRARDAAGNVSAYASLGVTTLEAAGETFSIYGAPAPTGAWVLGTGELPSITFGRGFYKFNSSDPTNGLPNARIVGARAWLPTGATGLPTEVTFYLFDQDIADLDAPAPVQTKVISLAGATAGTWVEGTFDAATSMVTDGQMWYIGARFTGGGDAGKYTFAPDARTVNDAVVSASGKHIAWAERVTGNRFSWFKIGAGASADAGDFNQSYGVDILVDAGA